MLPRLILLAPAQWNQDSPSTAPQSTTNHWLWSPPRLDSRQQWHSPIIRIFRLAPLLLFPRHPLRPPRLLSKSSSPTSLLARSIPNPCRRRSGPNRARLPLRPSLRLHLLRKRQHRRRTPNLPPAPHPHPRPPRPHLRPHPHRAPPPQSPLHVHRHYSRSPREQLYQRSHHPLPRPAHSGRVPSLQELPGL